MADIFQKEIYLASLDPVRGSEQGGKRPVVVISGETTNRVFPVVLVCPLSKVIKRLEGSPLIKRGSHNKLHLDSQAIVFQMRALSKERLGKLMGVITEEELLDIHQGIFYVLKY